MGKTDRAFGCANFDTCYLKKKILKKFKDSKQFLSLLCHEFMGNTFPDTSKFKTKNRYRHYVHKDKATGVFFIAIKPCRFK